jgi:hypothetical protein
MLPHSSHVEEPSSPAEPTTSSAGRRTVRAVSIPIVDRIGPAAQPASDAALSPADLDWWWQYGLDGVVGAIVGTLIGAALAAVVAMRVLKETLQHERALTVSAMEAEQRRIDEAATTGAASRMSAATFTLPFVLRTADEEAAERALLEIQIAAMEFTGRCMPRWPATSSAVQELGIALTEATYGPDGFDLEEATRVTQLLAEVGAIWVAAPEEVESRFRENGKL